MLMGGDHVVQCHQCYSYVKSIRKGRHDNCYRDWRYNQYLFPSAAKKYFCLICFMTLPNVRTLATHYSEAHHPYDVIRLGYNPSILARDHVSQSPKFYRDLQISLPCSD